MCFYFSYTEFPSDDIDSSVIFNNLMEKIVLFGAGASTGSGNVLPYDPPLGNQLYHELVAYFPRTWGNLPTELDKKFQINFESAMDEFIHSGNFSMNIPLLMRQMAEYFVDFKPSNDLNLYVKFLKELKPYLKKITFSTLNYDLLFECAVCKNGLKVTCFADEIDKIFYLKLHGSCNFIPATNFKAIDVRYTGTIRLLETPLKAVDVDEVICFCYEIGNSLYPTMSLFAPEKITQIGGGQILKIQEVWKEKVANAEKILTIGYKPLKTDKHVYVPLSETRSKIGFIGSKKYYDDWTSSDRNMDNSSYLGYKWSDSFKSSIGFLKD